MRLKELRVKFLKRVVRDAVYHEYVQTLGEADGVMFLCPKCFESHGGEVGTHSVICWFRGKVPDEASPGPGRWIATGQSLDDLTLVPSVHITSGCMWHGFVTDGATTNC